MPGEEVVVHARERAAAGKPSQQGRGDAEPKQLTFALHVVSSLHGWDGNRAAPCKAQGPQTEHTEGKVKKHSSTSLELRHVKAVGPRLDSLLAKRLIKAYALLTDDRVG